MTLHTLFLNSGTHSLYGPGSSKRHINTCMQKTAFINFGCTAVCRPYTSFTRKYARCAQLVYLYQLQGNAYCKRKCLLRKDTQQMPHNFSGKEPKINLSRDLDEISTCHDHISTCISLHVHTDILHYFFSCRISIQLFWMNLCWKWPCGTEMMLWQNLWKIITIKPGDMLDTDSMSCGSMDDLALETEK